MTKVRDKTKKVIEKAKIYKNSITSEIDSKKVRQSVYDIYANYVKRDFGLKENTALIEGKKIKTWYFLPDSEYSSGELSASRIASLLIKYRRALKSLGAINKKFIPSLHAAKKALIKAGVEQSIIDGLKPSLKIKTLEERIALLKRKYPRGSASGKGEMVRQALTSIKMYHPSYYRLAGAVSYVKSITNEQQKIRLKARHDEKIKINPHFLLNKAKFILDNPNSTWVQLTVALCAVTGRRPTEIMKTAKFRVDDKTPDNYIRFSGILKSRDRKFEEDFGEWNIPIFHDVNKIIKALRRLRFELKKQEKKSHESGGKGNYWTGGYLHYINQEGKNIVASIFDPKYTNDVDHNMAINQQYNGVLNNELRKWFESGDIEIKSLRAIYTKMVWEREKDTSSETYDSMTTRILCYSKDSISEAVKHYAAIELSEKTEKIETTTGTGKNYIPSEELMAKLEKANAIIEKRSARAPTLKTIHEWAKNKANLGLTLNELTPTYIRRYCRVGGKTINANTAKLYLNVIDNI